ncbi:MAG: DUF805 domain-containing protein [Planctomycetota bacterium]
MIGGNASSSRTARAILGRPKRWFLVDGPVSRSEYVLLGWMLAFLKYAIEGGVIFWLTGQFYSPVEFLNPWLNSKAGFLDETSGLAVIWFLFTIPFVLIAVSMSIRRAADVGWSPWWGLVVLVPVLNYVLMCVLSVVSSRQEREALEAAALRQQEHSAFRPPSNAAPPENWRRQEHSGALTAFFWALLLGVMLQVLVGMVSVWLFREYGLILFFTTPFFAGAFSGAVFNTRRKRAKLSLLLLIGMMNIASYIAMLCVGLDGAICLLLAFPLLGPLSYFGGLIGRAIVTANLRDRSEDRGMLVSMSLLPLALILEPLDDQRTLHRVDTTVVIDAGTTEVWKQVIAFPAITEPPAWFFRAGIAAPIRARIDGTGVGACRYCEFTTGPFVEPITAWDPPITDQQAGRLAFDVASQPKSMQEWTPFSGLHPPHLDEAFASRRGQFLIEPMAGGRTRLVGTTWYDIDVRPRLYWKIWADPTIHAIHERVLDHIRKQCELE